MSFALAGSKEEESARISEIYEWFLCNPINSSFPAALDHLDHGKADVSLRIVSSYMVRSDDTLIVQGGVIAVLADAAAVMAAMSVIPNGHTKLAGFSMDLVSASKFTDGGLTARAAVVRQNERCIWVDVEVISSAGEQKAFCLAKFAKPR